MGIFPPTVMPGRRSPGNRVHLRLRTIAMMEDIIQKRKSITCWRGKLLPLMRMHGQPLQESRQRFRHQHIRMHGIWSEILQETKR